VAAGQSQRFYSGVGIFNWYYLSSPPQILRCRGVELETRGLIYIYIYVYTYTVYIYNIILYYTPCVCMYYVRCSCNNIIASGSKGLGPGTCTERLGPMILYSIYGIIAVTMVHNILGTQLLGAGMAEELLCTHVQISTQRIPSR
jgi:hypothetical protein